MKGIIERVLLGTSFMGLPVVAYLALTLTSGCSPSNQQPAPPPPEPTVRVERQEDVNGVRLTIWFDNHKRNHLGNNRWGEPYATFTLNDKEKLTEYKKQLEFVLAQIEEVEKRMTVHEPEAQR